MAELVEVGVGVEVADVRDVGDVVIDRYTVPSVPKSPLWVCSTPPPS